MFDYERFILHNDNTGKVFAITLAENLKAVERIKYKGVISQADV